MTTLYDANGAPVIVGRELGRGGEGAVFELPSEPEIVAKVYHEAVSQDKQAKLAAMSTMVTPAITGVAAWPLRTLHADRRGGPVVGFVMPSVSSWPNIHCLYSPVERKRRFPEVRWSFLIHAARNAASAFETLHRHGVVIGDVNQSNVVVNPKKAEVRLVDCDSFQVHAKGRTHLCEVGIAHFTPPELQNLPFRGVVRTDNHDAFGLAVLCFHMLFMGRHPFAGRFLGAADMPIERAIAEHRFAYGVVARQRQMLPPPDSLPFECVGPGVTKLFELAFAGSASARPAPTHWVTALETLERNLQRCSAEPTHEYHSSVARCPWCTLETRSVFYFIGLYTRRTPGGVFDLAAAWAAITRIARPELPTLPSAISVAASRRSVLTNYRRAVGNAPLPIALIIIAAVALTGSYGVAIAAIICTIYLATRYGFSEDRNLRRALKTAEAHWHDISTRLQASARTGPFEHKLSELQRAHDEYLRLQREQHAELARLEASKRQVQLHAFLERFRIDTARITGIGPGRAATLSSYGIETAADLERSRIQSVPGFGEKRAKDLLAWRASVETRFVFNPSTQVPESMKAAIRKTFEGQLQTLQEVLHSGADVLEAIRRDVVRAHEMLRSEGTTIATEYSRAKSALSFRRLDVIPLPALVQPFRPTMVSQSPTVAPVPPRIVRPVVTSPSTPTCPRCGKSLVPRRGRHGPFWGCSSYPGCRYTRSR